MEKLTPPNRSHAVMSQRIESDFSLDFFPTPGWATRALMEKVLHMTPMASGISELSCLEPACGAGHMARVLEEYFPNQVTASDIHDYGFTGTTIMDFLELHSDDEPFVDWVITNPPFKHGEEFVNQGLLVAHRGVAMLVRTAFLETVGRYKNLYVPHPPTIVAQFSERVPMLKDRVNRKASTATSYAWLVWEKNTIQEGTRMVWIPPCRKELERDEDYDD